ncbi:MAG: PPC domain-containing protein [Candidatus Helarchaeota archaeon]
MKKKLFLTSIICCLIAFIFLLPPVIGYGSGFGDATPLSNGDHVITLNAGDNDAYFTIEVSDRTHLYISVAYIDSGSDDLDVYLYDPSQSEFSMDSTSANPTILDNEIETGGTYYLRIHRFSGSGDVVMTISITQTSRRIPGFEIMTTLFGLIISIGIILVLFRNRIYM